MSVVAGPKIPKKDLCLVVDARNPAIHSGSTTTITNIVEKSNNLTGTGIATVDDDVAGKSFSLVNGNRAMNTSWSPVIGKFSFTIIYWIKYQAGKNGDYSRIWEMDVIGNPIGYYYSADTRLTTAQYIHTYVRDYSSNSWASHTPITTANWTDSTAWVQLATTVAQESEWKQYINGKHTATIPTTNQDLTNYGNIDQVEFGGASGNAGCRVGYFSVYRRALTADEIFENYNAFKSRFGL